MWTRRELIRLLARSTAALALLPSCGDNTGDSIFTRDELNMLAGFADAIIPEDDTPGGARLGAVAYIERLLTAFDEPVPVVYAGGPFSDRSALPGAKAPNNDFATFVELDRATLAVWRPYVDELRTTLKRGLTEAASGQDVLALTAADFVRIFDAQPDELKSLLIDLVSEAAFAAPEYGGNPELAGWKLIHYEGDSLPLGYTQWDGVSHVERADAPMSTPSTSDPEPLTDDVRDVIALAITVLGGRVRT
jgi:hypothetical protein